MPSNKPKWLITVTPELNQQMNELVTSEGWEMNKSETIREAVVEYLQKHGVKAENNMPSHGGDRMNPDLAEINDAMQKLSNDPQFKWATEKIDWNSNRHICQEPVNVAFQLAPCAKKYVIDTEKYTDAYTVLAIAKDRCLAN